MNFQVEIPLKIHMTERKLKIDLHLQTKFFSQLISLFEIKSFHLHTKKTSKKINSPLIYDINYALWTNPRQQPLPASPNLNPNKHFIQNSSPSPPFDESKARNALRKPFQFSASTKRDPTSDSNISRGFRPNANVYIMKRNPARPESGRIHKFSGLFPVFIRPETEVV